MGPDPVIRSPDAVRVRQARAEDRAFVFETAGRLAAFGPPPWRTSDDVIEGEVRTLRDFFETDFHETPRSSSSSLLIAESEAGEPWGFLFLEELRDYFTHEQHGHIGILAVAEAVEGRGAGAALMRAAEKWSRDRRHRLLTLNVFENNRHARDVYEHFGYRQDTVKYIKAL